MGYRPQATSNRQQAGARVGPQATSRVDNIPEYAINNYE